MTLTIFSNCEPGYFVSEVITLQLPTCGCPTVSSFEAHADGVNKCLWRFEAKIGGPFTTCVSQYLWNFGDGAQLVTSVPQAEHSYDHDDTYVVTLTILGDVGEIGGGPCDTTSEIVGDVITAAEVAMGTDIIRVRGGTPAAGRTPARPFKRRPSHRSCRRWCCFSLPVASC